MTGLAGASLQALGADISARAVWRFWSTGRSAEHLCVPYVSDSSGAGGSSALYSVAQHCSEITAGWYFADMCVRH